jgi:hypothetical protein
MGRVKDNHEGHNHIVESLSPEMQAFNAELAQKFPKIRYTSGKRSASQNVGKYSKVSHHNTGNAFDIGAEHKDVYEFLNNTEEGLLMLTKYGLGIIDETDPEMMKKTGATGKHYHIGKDSKFAKMAQEKLKTVPKTEKPKESEVTLNIGQNQNGEQSFVTLEQFKAEVEKIKAKEEAEEKKKEESAEMQEIERKKNEKLTFLQEVTDMKIAPRQKNDESSYQENQQGFRFDPQEVAQNNMQPLFSTGLNVEE